MKTRTIPVPARTGHQIYRAERGESKSMRPLEPLSVCVIPRAVGLCAASINQLRRKVTRGVSGANLSHLLPRKCGPLRRKLGEPLSCYEESLFEGCAPSNRATDAGPGSSADSEKPPWPTATSLGANRAALGKKITSHRHPDDSLNGKLVKWGRQYKGERNTLLIDLSAFQKVDGFQNGPFILPFFRYHCQRLDIPDIWCAQQS